MRTRAAVALEAGKPLEVMEVNLEGPKAGEVMVEIKATGICHTDEFTRSGDDPEGLFPATPESCIECVLSTGVNLQGKKAVIVGRGETVGKPLVFMLLKYNPTITICHSRTADLAKEVKEADVVIAAVGKAGLVTGDMLKPGAIVVDAGVNEVEGGYVGDVDFESAEKVASAISPVPGGVGSLTTVLLFRNLMKGMKMQLGR